MRLALCQLDVGEKKAVNLLRAEEMLKKRRHMRRYGNSARNVHYKIQSQLFFIASEPLIIETYGMLSQTAKETNMAIIAASMLSFIWSKVYNTCLVFDKDREFVGRYRKAHLFDVGIRGFSLPRSRSNHSGRQSSLIFDEPIKTGVSICFDIRFPNGQEL